MATTPGYPEARDGRRALPEGLPRLFKPTDNDEQFFGGVSFTPGAGNNMQVQLYNPGDSQIVVIIDDAQITSAAAQQTTFLYTYTPLDTLVRRWSASGYPGAAGRAEIRTRDNTDASGSAFATISTATVNLAVAGSLNIVLAPGVGLLLIGSVLANASRVTFRGRERPR
jgi:hypothetical protein